MKYTNIGNKKNIRKLLLFTFLFISLFLILQWCAKNYITTFLAQKTPSQFTVTYSDIDVNILSGTIALHNTSIKTKNTDTLQNQSYLKSEMLQIKGIGYWNLLFNKTLSINNFVLKNPQLNYDSYKHSDFGKTKNNANTNKLKTIIIKQININNGSLNIIKQNTDSSNFSVSSYNLTLLGSKIDIQDMVSTPLTYDSFKIEAQNIVSEKSDFETFKIDTLYTNEKSIHIDNLQIIPKYNKEELSKHLSIERDYIDLNISKIILNKVHFNFNDTRFGIKATAANIITPNLEIYRDKLLPDDLTTKPLYSKSLRDLPFNLEINQVNIKDGYISYAELVELDTKAGKIYFNKVDASIKHISNLKHTEKTDIKIRSKLMGKAPLELNWNFDVNNAPDSFLVSGEIRDLPAKVLNPFFKPNLNAVTQGTLQQMYFTFYGNNTKSKGEMKMKYDDFKFKILRENGFEINKVLTAIGNIFVNDGSKTNAEGFRFGNIEAERDTTKSFFNYLWINIKSGIISTVTSNGKKQ